MEKTPMFSIFYYDQEGNLVKGPVSPERIKKVGLEINIEELIDNVNLGTALLRGFLMDRSDEFVRLVRVIRAKKEEEKAKILTPEPMSGLKIVH